MSETLYQVLGVAPAATPREIRDAYWALALKYHPDKISKAGAKIPAKVTARHDRFCRITEAWSVLGSVERRRDYDRALQMLRTPCGTCVGEGQVWKQKGFGQRVGAPCPACGGSGYATK